MPSRVKSLELQGYKTFANRTLFVFADMVTAIVGPNGSGKSNISDGLRWVLGEQAYSLLRAKKTEDMIFSGSENRPRSGMASATIVFDNSDNWLPIDFSEVAITRRAYRDGDNEYLINGQRIRLKDVSELLAQSGLAERTYTIIGQGLVDAALSLKAEERRRLFEEAAGIGLYRTRREDAIRRLDSTRRNLERVQDILAELKPRLNSLERQARRTREYEHIKADLQVYLREWYGYHWHRAQKELLDAQEVARLQESKAEKSRKELYAVENELSMVRDRSHSLRVDLNNWHRQLAEHHSKREAVIRQLTIVDERSKFLNDVKRTTEAELINLREDISLQNEHILTLQEEETRLRNELDEAREQFETAQSNLLEQQNKRAVEEDEVQAMRQELAVLNTRNGQLEARLYERQVQIDKSQKLLEDVIKNSEEVDVQKQAAFDRLQSEEAAVANADKAVEKSKEAVASITEKIQAAGITQKRLATQKSEVLTTISRVQAQLKVLEQAEASLSGYAVGARAVIQSAQEDNLANVLGPLSKHLEISKEFEIAIASALGEFIDGVLIEGETEKALIILESSGRGALIPLDELINLEPMASVEYQDPDIFGIAAKLVKVPDRFRPVIDLLLGNTIIVRNRQTAKKILMGMKPGLCAVTLNGQVFYSSGLIHNANIEGVGESLSVLSRIRQIREARSELQELENQYEELQDDINRAEKAYKDLELEGGQLEQVLGEKRQLLEKAIPVANQVRLLYDQTQQKQILLHEQRDRLQNEIAQDELEAEKLNEELNDLGLQLEQIREIVRQKSIQLAELSLDEFQSQVAHWNLRIAVSERVLVEAVERLKDRRDSVDKLESSYSTLEKRLSEIEEEIKTLLVSKSTAAKAETEIGEQIQAVQALIAPAESLLSKNETDVVSLQKEESAARQSLSMAEHFNSQTRVALARQQESLQSLRNRIEDDFGLVAFEYADQVAGPTPLPLDGMVEQLPKVNKLQPELEESVKRLRAQLRRMGAINPEAQAEYQEVKGRFEFLSEQVLDLHQADRDVREVIAELDTIMEREFRKTFQAVAVEFREIFSRLFGGGVARLVLTDPDDFANTGIDIEARLPGKRAQGLAVLSGGERSLTATALVFALLKVSPTPFCVLDEVDAMLDEMNVGRFRELLRELSEKTQFLIITHNRNTVQVADIIYGVTMGRDSASQVLSLKLDEISKVID